MAKSTATSIHLKFLAIATVNNKIESGVIDNVKYFT